MRRLVFGLTAAATAAGCSLSLGCTPHAKRQAVADVRYLEIPVANLDRAVGFYEAVFAVPLERETVDGYAMARFPSLGERRGADVALAQGDVYVPSKTGTIVYFHVDDVAAVLARAAARGAAILLPRKEVAPGVWVAEFSDSEGNRIALSQRDE